MATIASGQQRRALVIAGVGFGLVFVLFAGSRFLAGGGGGGEPAPTFPTTSTPRTAPGTPPAGGDEDEVPVVAIPLVPDSFEALEIRDPFTPPLAVIDLARSLQPDPIPPRPGQPAPPTRPGQPAPPTQPGAPGRPSNVALRGIELAGGEELATLQVDGAFFEAGEGDRFGPNGEFMVVSLDAGAQCGTFLFGDESFRLCVGQNEPAPGDIPQK